jgi:hypothetical protein
MSKLAVLTAFSLLFGANAWAIPQPVNALADSAPWIVLRLDVRNVTGPGDSGRLPASDLISRVQAANEVWSQCSIRFTSRSARNVSARDLGVDYEPKSQSDLSRLASALNPHGFKDAIPFTIAGPWHFYDPGTGLYLTGLGWVFTNGSGTLDRIGAMIDSQRVHLPIAGLLIAHELAHALSLPHVAERDNLMGPGGTSKLTADQCRRAREFASTTLSGFERRQSITLK